MKLAILVSLATVVSVASYRPSHSSGVYKPGEQYVYHYKGQVLNGMPKSSNQFSGVIIDCLVLLQFQQDNKVVMKMENIKLYKIDNKITALPSEALPESEMTRLTGEQEKAIVDKLVLPLKFRYEEGEIRELQKETRDEYWSMNIKKGLLTMFQVTLKEKHSLNSESSIYYDPTMSRIKSYGSRTYGSSSSSSSSSYWSPALKTNSVFTVKETDVSGNCETKYTVVQEKTSQSSGSIMYVTAVRNFESCHTRPFNIEGLFQGVPASSSEKDIIQPTVHTDYVITGDRSHFMIREATTRGKYHLFVNGLEGADLSSYVFQRITLKQGESIRNAVHLVSPRAETRGLQMVIPKASLVEEREREEREGGQYENHLYRKRVQQEYELNKAYESEEFYHEEDLVGEAYDINPVAMEKLNKLKECIYSHENHKKCSDFLMEITMLMREATETELEGLCMTNIKQHGVHGGDTDHRISEMLLDILPTLNNPNAAKVLIKLIRTNRISHTRASLMVPAMSMIAKPTPTVIKSLLETFKEFPKETTETTITSTTMLRQASLLALGTMTHRLLVVMRSQGKPDPTLITFVDTLSMELKRMLEETNNESEKILILKSMGNMGSSENIVAIKSIIEDRRQTPSLRISACIALRRLAKEFKKQVIPSLMGIVMDVNEMSELRQVAFLVIIRANPTYTTLQMIGHRVNYDKNNQLKTLVYSNLINLAYYTSHQPEHKTLMKHARLVLKTMNPVNVGVYDSVTVLFSQFNEEWDMGASIDFTKIKSHESWVPQAIVSTLHGTFLGKHRNLLELGTEGKALQGILKKVFGPHGILSQLLKGRISLEDVLKPLAKIDLGGVEHKIVEIMNKMRMAVPGDQVTELYTNYFLHLLNNEVQYLPLNERNYKDLVLKITRMFTNLFDKLTSGTTFDMVKATTHQAALTVATTMGIPLHFNHTLYAIMKTEGSVKISANFPTDLSSLWHTYKRFSFPQSIEQIKRVAFDMIPEFKVDLNMKPVFDMSHYVTFGTDLRWMSTGVGVEGFLKVDQPVRVCAEFSKPKGSISVKYFTNTETKPWIHARAVPILFVTYVPTTVNKLPYMLEVKEIRNEEIIKTTPFNFEKTTGSFGHDLEIKGVYSLCGPNWCPVMPLFGKQEIMIKATPMRNVEFIELKMYALKNNFEYEGIPSDVPTEELYQELEQEFYGSEREIVNYRTASRSQNEKDKFDPVMVDEIFSGETPIKRQLRVTIKPNTFNFPSLMSQVTWFMGRQSWKKNQINFQFIHNGQHDIHWDYSVNWNTVVNMNFWCPEESYAGLRGDYLTKTTLKLTNNGNTKVIKMRVVPGSPFDFTTELRRQRLLPVDDLPEAQKQAIKYTLEVEFPQIGEKEEKVLMWIDDAVKFVLYNKLSTEIPRNSENNKLTASVEILPWWEKMNMIVKNPRENIYIANVPFFWNPFLTTDQRTKSHDAYTWKFYKRSVYEKIWGQEQSELVSNLYTPLLTKGECKVDFLKQYVSTFDGAYHSIKPTLIKLKQQGCGLLTAQDCSREGLFSLNVKSYSEQAWVAALHLPQADIEVEVSEGNVRASVNGQVISLRQSQVYRVPQHSESSSYQHVIELISSEEILIKSQELGLTVHLDQRVGQAYVHISHGSMLWGNICGLCGNNNQDPSDDLDLPRGHKVRSSRPFYLNSIIPSESCSLDTPALEADYCKKTTDVIIRRYDNESLMSCTSERQVVQCSEGCRPAKTSSIKTCFRCLSESGQTQARRSYYHPASVWEIEESGQSCEEYAERVEVPLTCEPIY